MNYAGKFDAAISLDGQGSRSPGHDHVDSFTAKAHGHVPDGAVVVADPNLIFHGDFKRAGLDLVLSHDGHEFVAHDYFRGDKRAAISSPDGAHLTGDIVSALTGYVQVAQAAPAADAAHVIGHVTKLTGSATAIRNGVSVILNNGDNVEKGDVVSTGSDSTLGITFIDGTVFGLSSNARMVLNEMVYDPNGSNNSSLLSLVAGTITFVAGETAKHGDMKVDTPVATMGIRGTAVLNQISFVIPPGGGDPQPQVSFQVLVEPNGTTGSYILFDKLTLLPIATVNQAGQMIQISGGNVSITNALLSPDVQRLITDVFTLKFTDNGTNTKLTTNFTDSLTQDGNNVLIKTQSGATAQATYSQTVNYNTNGQTQGPANNATAGGRIATADSLFLTSLDATGTFPKATFNLTEVAGQTGVKTADVIIGKATFLDFNLGDRPTVKVVLDDGSFVYQDAGQHDVTATLSALQKHDIVAAEVNITVVPTSTNDSNGSAIWTFSVPDSAFDFLAKGETLTLKYTIILNNNFVDDPGIVTQDITIVITGTNDTPVITSDAPTITFAGGTSTQGGSLKSDVPTSGTLIFTDVDLTDTHTVSLYDFSAVLPDGTVPESIYKFLKGALLFSIDPGHDSTGTGTGSITWSLKDIPVYLADFIPQGEVLTLTYTVRVTDSQGATSDQTVTVTITGTDAPAVVWIATNETDSPSGGFWKDGANWETGNAPTSSDDVIVITDQLVGLTPSYPVTISEAAYAKSLTMNDFDITEGHTVPEVINQSTLTITQTLTLKADSKLTNLAAGTITVGGAAEFLDTSVLANAGYLKLENGGDFAVGTWITNSGTIELSGGTLKTLAEINNAGGALNVGADATLIVSGATIDGGAIVVLPGTPVVVYGESENTDSGTIITTGRTVGTVTNDGTLELTGYGVLSDGILKNNGVLDVSGAGNALNGETVTNPGTIEVLTGALAIGLGSTVDNSSGNVVVDADAELTLSLATISGGAVKGDGDIDVTGDSTIDSGATLSVATVTADAKLTLDGVTVSGSVITDNASIELDNTVKLQDDAEIKGGPVTNNGTLEISGPATLLNDVVTNNGTVKVDGSQTLTVSGSEISGGAINGTGTIDVTGSSKVDGGATLSTSAITVEAGTTLTLDTATVDGTTITDKGSITVDGTVKLTGGALIQGSSSAFAPKGGSPITVEFNWGQLGTSFTYLSSPQQIVATDGSGGTVSSAGGVFELRDEGYGWGGNFAPGTHLLWDRYAGPDITIKFATPVSSAGAQIMADYYGAFTAEIIAYDLGGNVIGTVSENGVSNGNNDGSAIFIDFVSSSADIATIKFLVTSATYLPNDFALGPVQFAESPSVGGSGPIVNNGTLEITGAATLLNDIVTNHGTVSVDANRTLTLSGTEINGGSIAGAGTIDVTGTSAIDGGATLSTSFVTVENLQTLILDAMTVDGTTITDKGSVELDDTVTLKGGATIQGASADVRGAVTNNGTLEVAGAATLLNDVVTNNGIVQVDGSQILTLSGTEISGGAVNGTGTIDVTGASKIDGGATLSTGFVTVESLQALILDAVTVDGTTITDKGSIELDDTVKLQGGATIQGTSADVRGPITNNGTLEIAGAAKLLNDTVTNNGTVTVDDSQILTLSGTEISGGAINGSGTIDVIVASKIDGGATLSTSSVIADAKLTLDGVTMSGSTITDNSSIELDDTVKLQSGATIQGASVDAKGPVTNNGTLEIGGAATLLNDVVTNNGTVQVDDGQILTLSGTEISGGTINNFSGLTGGTIDVTGDSTIDTGATLNKGAVTVESDVTLTFGDATVSASKLNSSGTVKVETDKKMTLAGASLTGGALTIAGTLASSGNTTITDANISNLYLLESTLGGLLTLVATTSAPVITNDGGTIRANNAELDINTESVTNTGTLAAINDGTLKLISTQVTNTGGAVSVELGSTLDLSDAGVTGGTLTIAGTLESTGTSAITSADITNTGTITVTSGKLTIDPAVIHTLTNNKLLQANGGELDITSEAIVNTADIKALNGGILKLSTLDVTNGGGTVTVDGTSKLYLTDVSINGGSLNNSGNVYSVSGGNNVTGAVINTGTIEVQADTLNLSGGLSGVGTLIIDDTATLELAGATAQTVTFAGGADTLQLDKVAGQSFTGTITGQSSTGGTFTVTSAADITASTGDALDFTASDGSSIKPANIVLKPTGTLTGAAGGIGVTQSGTGDISLTATGNVTGLAGNGITLSDSASGFGNITINNLTGKATGTGANSEGVLVQNLNAANAGDISITQLGGAVGDAFGIDATTLGNGDVTIDAGGNITGSSTYAIRARSYGSGDITVTTEAGSVVTSGSSGIIAVNRSTSLDASNDSTITVNAHGAINSGSSLNQSGNPPAGIQAGYAGATSSTHANTSVNGTVVVNNYADITAAAGSGIDAYNYGNGDVTVNSFAGTTISVAGTQSNGIQASALSGGTGDVTIALGANVTISGATAYGIKAYSIDAGDINVTLAKGDSITSGSTGIVAVNYATSIGSGLDSTITVEAHGTIHSGSTLNNDNATPGGIIAGYKPGGNANFSGLVNGDVIVDSDAKITADAGYGIEAFTWGAGDVTVSTGETSSITAAGTAIGAFDHGGGDVSVTNEGSATGAIGLSALATDAGDVTIVNDGDLTGTGTVGISVTQNATGASGSTHITNTGSVVAANGYAAIAIHENATGTATIDNSGTIGPADASTVVSTTYAIFETGGAITVNNTGHINGNISVASATFNNELGGTWTVSGTSVFGTLSSIDNAGEIDLHGGASISSADGLSFAITNSGEIESWGTTSITGSITNTNTIEIHADGTLSLFGSLSGAGSVTIDAGATLVVDATVSQTITFNGDGSELSIKTADFGGSIAGLAATDKIDLSSIDYGLGTSAIYVANNDASTGGTLTISDAGGHHISLTLTGADYSHTNFAGSDDGTGHTLITVNAADDAPSFTTNGATLTASFSELASTTNSGTPDPSPAATGSIAFTDVDLVDRPTATVTHQDVTWLDSDHTTQLTLTPDEISALGSALSLQQTGNNNGTVGWSYSIADSTLDFLAQGQTATVVSTITLDDGHNKTDTTHVTVTISGANDAPTLDNATLAAVSEDPTAPAGSTVGKLFTTGFHDVDNGSSLSAVAITADHATVDQGVWQYEIAGSNQWIDISGVSDTGALVLATDTLIRFVPAANYSGVPGSLDVHALDNTYSGGVSGDTPVVIDINSSAIGSSVSAQPATLNTEVTPVADPPAFAALAVNYLADSLTGNSIDTTKWHVVLPSVPGTDDDASVTPTANGVVLHDHGYLETTSGFTPTTATPLHVGLSFSLDDGIGPYVAVTDGTDGTTGAYGSPVNGLSFMFGWGNGLIITNNATGANVNLSASLSQGTVYDATITDDGSHQTVVIVDHSTGATVGTYTSDFTDYAAGNLVTITNREANDSQHDATVSNVTISNAYEGDHGAPIALSGLTAVTDTDGSEHMSLDLSGFPEGATFSVGQAGTGAEAGHWLISSSDIATLGASPLTMTAPADYTGEFSLHVSGTVVDQATGLGGSLSDSKTFTSDVAVKVDGSAPAGGPVIDTDSFTVSHNGELNTDTIRGLSITDTDSGASTDDFTVTAVTAHEPVDGAPGSTVGPSSVSGSLDAINNALFSGVTYNPGDAPPDQDQITFTVTDKTTGLSDTVNFIFNEGDATNGVALNGTVGKDVIFATTTGDTLSGGGGQDQFVFAPGSVGYDETGHPSANYSHTITDFIEGVDRIDLRQFSDVGSIHDLTIAEQDGGKLVSWQQQIGVGEGSVTEHETLLLSKVTANLQASDFIFGSSHIT